MKKHTQYKEEVTQKILNTARETEKLKKELEELLSLNIKTKSVPQTLSPKLTSVNSSNKVQIIKSYDPKHSKHVKPHVINNTELKDQAEALSPKKIKEYDVEEIRKHIKKQRDKRTDELKSNKNAPKVEKEIRKEKLQELHRKAREILKKNIQHKKATRSKSQEVPMFRSLNKEPFRKISKLPVEEEVIIINSAGFSFSPTHNTNKLQTQNRNSVSLNNINTLDEPISVLKKNNNDAGGNVLDKNLLCPPKAISNLGYVLKKANKRSVEDHSDASFRKSPDGSKLQLSNAESHSSSKKFKNLVQPTLEEPKTQVPLIPVQKSPQKRTPEWLKEAAPSDPFNFINTVKRQLKFINTDDRKPHYVDVGVQGSLEELNSAASSSSADGKSQFKNNDLRSFISHKCLNLNPEIVDHHVASLHHSSKELKDGPTINYSDNDSDTSKNIPSISSETVASSLRKSDALLTENNNYYSSRPENLNVARIEGITLKTSSNKTNNDKSLNNDRVEILSVKKQLFSSESNNVSNNYSSDFDSPDLLKKRSNSIISYNRVETPDKEELSKSSRISTEMNNSEEFDSQNALKKLIEKISSTNNSISEAGGGGGSDSHSVKNSSLSSIETMSLDNSNSKSKLNFNSLGKSVDVSSSSSNSNKNQSSLLHTVTSVDKNALKDPQENSKKSTSMEKTVAENGIQIISDVKIFQIPKLSSSSTNFVKADPRQNLIRNITLRTKENNGVTGNCSKNPALKFETEIDLLTNFNQTMKRFSEIEKAFESLQVEQVHKNKQPEHKETQTSLHRKSTGEPTNRNNESTKEPEVAVNHQNATERLSSSNSIEMQLDELFHFISVEESLAESLFVEPENTVNEIAHEVEVPNKNFLGILLKMFDRLIKEEDARIDNWKKTLNLREQALLDRTRSELLYLEIQKKQLIETGKLAEASLVKKKQRGIIIKHQQERHEMQRLKQMQKEDSRNLKSSLKKEKKEIKLQLLSGQISPKFKPHSHIRRKSNNEPGPFRVLQQTSESTLLSETSLSRGNDYPELHIKNITTRRHSQMNVVSNITNMELESLEWAIKNNNTIKSNAVNEFKKTLLMREQKLAKRKKTVEELLQWHKRLLDEEKAIENLENEIGTIIGKIPAPSPPPSSNNNNAAAEGNNEELLLTNQSSQFNDNDDGSISNAESISLPPSSMSSQISVKPSTANNNNNKEIIEEISKQQSYSTDFEADATDISPALVEVEAASTTTITTLDGQTNISSISKLIENFSKIEDDLLNLTYSKTISDETNNNNKNDEEEDNSENVLVEKETVDVVDEVSSSNSVIDEVVPIIISTASSVEAPLSENDLVVNTSSVEIEEIVNEEDNAKTSDSSIVTASFVENKTDEEKAALSNRAMLKLNPSVEEKINNSQASTSTLLLITEKNINNTTTTTTTAKSNGSDKALAIKGRFSINSNAVGILNEPAFSEDPVTHSVSIKSANNDEINNSPSRIQESPNSAQSSESSDSSGEDKKSLCLDSEVEELQRKQMAIEEEIKLLTEQQQKETTSPSFYVREIPNKPPPPYTPPSKVKPPKIISVTPSSVEEVEQTSEYCAKIIYKAYLSNNLDNITISDTTLNLIAKDIDKDCFKYIFDLCKEIAQTHYSQFQISTCPSWLLAESKVFLAHPKPLDEIGLKKLMKQKVLELHGFAKSTTTTTTSKREISTAKWSSKKRDHVDQVLVQEMQAENAAWTNYAKDEALVKDRLTNEIMDMLLKETALVLKTTLNKKVVSVV